VAGFRAGLLRVRRQGEWLHYAQEEASGPAGDPSPQDELARHRAAFCIYELGGRHSPEEVTADFVYVRLHGPAGPYRGLYDAGTLARWAGKFRAWAAQGRRVHCYFDNDQEGFAARNALQLQEMLLRD